ncbi:MAG: M24 family metallopeptidase [Anaerolineae bacterium]|nr:M24 family metallopeptidase [Anaerolineae bacterium]
MELPAFGLPTVEPTIPLDVYQKRVKIAQNIWFWRRLSAVMVYADREHAANLAYLTGYDARFEEALLIFNLQPETSDSATTRTDMIPIRLPERAPTLVVGNEGWAYAAASPLSLTKVLYQNFSLPGQPRNSSESLSSILQTAGVHEGGKIGVVGWKSFTDKDTSGENTWLDIPSYIADTLRSIVGEHGEVTNITDTLIDPINGLKNINDVDQLAVFEFAATHTSQALRNVLFKLRPGMTEYEAVQLMHLNGMPHSVHLMLSSGERTRLGLASPSSKTIQYGDPFTMAFGLFGALNARAGFVVRDGAELPLAIRDYVEKLVAPYFRAVVDWYELVGIGVTGGQLYEAIHKQIGARFFGVTLNPGHFIHIDEWTHSPVYKNSTVPLKSGMTLQVDVIPATGTPYFTSNIEDGIALADEELRSEFAERYPEAWTRIQARRDFMQNVLGIRLKPEVLPFSNIPAYLPPYLLSPQRAMQVIAS